MRAPAFSPSLRPHLQCLTGKWIDISNLYIPPKLIIGPKTQNRPRGTNSTHRTSITVNLYVRCNYLLLHLLQRSIHPCYGRTTPGIPALRCPHSGHSQADTNLRKKLHHSFQPPTAGSVVERVRKHEQGVRMQHFLTLVYSSWD